MKWCQSEGGRGEKVRNGGPKSSEAVLACEEERSNSKPLQDGQQMATETQPLATI